MGTQQSLARIGAIAALAGVVVLAVATMLHPMDADPNDPRTAFAEYAADPIWVWSHLGQFLGIAALGAALIGLGATFERGRAAAWGRLGLAGAAVTVAVAGALQAVDGVALKVMVDRWAAATGEERALAFETALAVRQIEIGLASLLSISFGLTTVVFAIVLLLSVRYPPWLGATGLLGGLGSILAGAAQASTGFSELAMMTSMLAGAVLLVWFVVAGILMWLLAARLEDESSVERAMASLERGEAIPHEEVADWVRSWGTRGKRRRRGDEPLSGR